MISIYLLENAQIVYRKKNLKVTARWHGIGVCDVWCVMFGVCVSTCVCICMGICMCMYGVWCEWCV